MKKYISFILLCFCFVFIAQAQQTPSRWVKETALRGKGLAGYSQESGNLKGYLIDSIMAQSFGIYPTPVSNVLPSGNATALRSKIVTDTAGQKWAVDFYGNATRLNLSPNLSAYASKTALADSITNIKSKDSIIFYSGVIRNTGGTFGFIDDGQHAAINITSVNTLSNNQIEIGLTEGTTTSLVAVPDESYAARKIRCGTSVGSNLAVISMFSDEGLDGRVYFNGTAFALGSVNGLWYRSSADAVITWNTTNSARPFIRFEHPNSVFTTAQISNLLLNSWYGSSVNTYAPKLKAVGSNYFEFYFVNAAGAIVTTPDFFCDIVFNRGGTYAIKNEYSQVSSSNVWLLGQAKK